MGYQDRRLQKGALVAEEGSKIHAAHYVPAGRDRFRGQREIHFTRTLIDFKVSTLDTDGGLAVCEITSLQKGGPARHLHHRYTTRRQHPPYLSHRCGVVGDVFERMEADHQAYARVRKRQSSQAGLNVDDAVVGAWVEVQTDVDDTDLRGKRDPATGGSP